MVRTYGVVHPAGLHLPRRTFDWGQLCHCVRGVMSVHTAAGVFVAPPHRAVFVPAGTEHRVEMTGVVDVRTVYFAPSLSPQLWQATRAVAVTPLLRELIVYTTGHGLLRKDRPAERRLAWTLLDQMTALPSAPLSLPQPRDARAVKAAALLLSDAEPDLDLDQVARRAGASRRTLERHFVDETGLTLGRWRLRVRLLRALQLLGEHRPVSEVALLVGYETPSAFVAAFKRELGETPGRYYGASAGGRARSP